MIGAGTFIPGDGRQGTSKGQYLSELKRSIKLLKRGKVKQQTLLLKGFKILKNKGERQKSKLG